MHSTDIKTLVIDIETAPHEAYVWGLFNQNVGLSQIKANGYILSFAAKWVGEDEMIYHSLHTSGNVRMLWEAHRLLDEADEVVTYNGISFDHKLLNTEFIANNLPPPSPYKKVDLYRTVKGVMRTASNKLDFVSSYLGMGHKVEHEGFPLWVACMQGDKEAWKRMREYNEGDVLLTERLYARLRPWITTGVNRSAFVDSHICPTCGSVHVHSRGYTRTMKQVYKRYFCTDCGTWSRSAVAEKQENKREQLVLAR